jgi:hypothetical protein
VSTAGGVAVCQRRGCRVPIAPGKFACDLHWLEVPLELRRDLVDALAVHGEHSEQTGAAVEAVVIALRTAGLR